MKFYFAGSIRGGRASVDMYRSLIKVILRHGTVLTEHVGDASLSSQGERRSDESIFLRDIAWIHESDAVIAEVTNPSLGVGYEIREAEECGKPVLCLFSSEGEKRLSAMISGNAKLTICTYASLQEAEDAIGNFVSTLERRTHV